MGIETLVFAEESIEPFGKATGDTNKIHAERKITYAFQISLFLLAEARNRIDSSPVGLTRVRTRFQNRPVYAGKPHDLNVGVHNGTVAFTISRNKHESVCALVDFEGLIDYSLTDAEDLLEMVRDIREATERYHSQAKIKPFHYVLDMTRAANAGLGLDETAPNYEALCLGLPSNALLQQKDMFMNDARAVTYVGHDLILFPKTRSLHAGDSVHITIAPRKQKGDELTVSVYACYTTGTPLYAANLDLFAVRYKPNPHRAKTEPAQKEPSQP